MDSNPPFLTEALPNLQAWTRFFVDSDIPVQADTAAALEALRAAPDDVDAHILNDAIAPDPLMSLKVLALAARQRATRPSTQTETITATLVMMGVSPFFNAFGPQPTVEERLAAEPVALAGLRRVLARAHRASNFALGFAVHRMDYDADVICLAALLHDFSEMLLWCHAPALALQIAHAKQHDPRKRSREAQRECLNIEMADLQQALMKAWHLPELLVRISDDRHADQANVQSVVFAIRLARHTEDGWDNPAVPDDIKDISQLLNLSTPATLELLHRIHQ